MANPRGHSSVKLHHRSQRAVDPGQAPGQRRLAGGLGEFRTETAGYLPSVRIAYETWGELNADASNAVLVLHALTGDSHVTGAPGPGHPTAGWWSDILGSGKYIDTDRWFVVAPNLLGGCQGSTGPASLAPDGLEWGSRFPYLTIRDQVDAQAALSDTLGIGRWAAIVGGSLTGWCSSTWSPRWSTVRATNASPVVGVRTRRSAVDSPSGPASVSPSRSMPLRWPPTTRSSAYNWLISPPTVASPRPRAAETKPGHPQ